MGCYDNACDTPPAAKFQAPNLFDTSTEMCASNLAVYGGAICLSLKRTSASSRARDTKGTRRGCLRVDSTIPGGAMGQKAAKCGAQLHEQLRIAGGGTYIAPGTTTDIHNKQRRTSITRHNGHEGVKNIGHHGQTCHLPSAAMVSAFDSPWLCSMKMKRLVLRRRYVGQRS